MLFIAQKKVTDHICNNKDILANINLDLKLVCDHFVHRVASSKSTVSRKDDCDRIIERLVSFERIFSLLIT